MSETPINESTVLAEVRGLRQIVDLRFDAFEREQDMVREWLGRVSATLDRVTETLSRTVNIETRQGQMEAEISDIQLDLAAVQADVTSIKQTNFKKNLFINAIIGFVSTAATALGLKVLGAK